MNTAYQVIGESAFYIEIAERAAVVVYRIPVEVAKAWEMDELPGDAWWWFNTDEPSEHFPLRLASSEGWSNGRHAADVERGIEMLTMMRIAGEEVIGQLMQEAC
jgi:hypothetical protein